MLCILRDTFSSFLGFRICFQQELGRGTLNDNVHDVSQGAELMSQYGVNVPPGVPVFKLEEVLPAAKRMADEEGQVCEAP